MTNKMFVILCRDHQSSSQQSPMSLRLMEPIIDLVTLLNLLAQDKLRKVSFEKFTGNQKIILSNRFYECF